MASNPDFVQFIADQCAKAGDITTRKMFGDYSIYCNGKIFGVIVKLQAKKCSFCSNSQIAG